MDLFIFSSVDSFLELTTKPYLNKDEAENRFEAETQRKDEETFIVRVEHFTFDGRDYTSNGNILYFEMRDGVAYDGNGDEIEQENIKYAVYENGYLLDAFYHFEDAESHFDATIENLANGAGSGRVTLEKIQDGYNIVTLEVISFFECEDGIEIDYDAETE